MKRRDAGFRSVTELDREYPLWKRLSTNSDQRDPFCCLPAWQLAFNESRDPHGQIFIRESNDSFVALSQRSIYPSRQRPADYYLKPIEHGWCFGNNVLGPNGAELLHDLFDGFGTPLLARSTAGNCEWNRAAGSYLQSPLKKYFSKDFTFLRFSSDVQCGASRGGVDGFYSRRSANHRKKIRQQLRRAHDAGVTLKRHRPTSKSEADGIFKRMLKVELASWKGIEDCGMTEPVSKAFYDALLKRLVVSEDARIIFAMHEGNDIGFIFGSMAAKIYRGQQFSFDESWSHASIGNVLQAEQIKWLCEEGAVRYDMGPRFGPGMEYKKTLERLYHIQTWFLVKR